MKAAPTDAAETGAGATLWTETEFGDAEFIVDFQPPKAAGGAKAAGAALSFRGARIALAGAEGGKFSRFTVTVQGGKIRVRRVEPAPSTKGGEEVVALPAAAPARGALGLIATPGGGTFMNLHARAL